MLSRNRYCLFPCISLSLCLSVYLSHSLSLSTSPYLYNSMYLLAPRPSKQPTNQPSPKLSPRPSDRYSQPALNRFSMASNVFISGYFNSDVLIASGSGLSSSSPHKSLLSFVGSKLVSIWNRYVVVISLSFSSITPTLI